MKFHYKKFPGPVLRPVIPITVTKNGLSVFYEVLVDSGADLNVFDAEIGEVLGIDVESGQGYEAMVRAIENGEADGILCQQESDLSRNIIHVARLMGLVRQGSLKSIQTMMGEVLGSVNVPELWNPIETMRPPRLRVSLSVTASQRSHPADGSARKRRVKRKATWLTHTFGSFLTLLFPNVHYELSEAHIVQSKNPEIVSAEALLITEEIECAKAHEVLQALQRFSQTSENLHLGYGHTGISTVLLALPIAKD